MAYKRCNDISGVSHLCGVSAASWVPLFYFSDVLTVLSSTCRIYFRVILDYVSDKLVI